MQSNGLLIAEAGPRTAADGLATDACGREHNIDEEKSSVRAPSPPAVVARSVRLETGAPRCRSTSANGALAGYRDGGIQLLRELAVARCVPECGHAAGRYGPVHTPATPAGKIFAGLYALYAGLIFLVTAGVLLAPVMHRVLHRFHWEEKDGR